MRGGRTIACYSRPGLDLPGMAWLRELAWPVRAFWERRWSAQARIAARAAGDSYENHVLPSGSTRVIFTPGKLDSHCLKAAQLRCCAGVSCKVAQAGSMATRDMAIRSACLTLTRNGFGIGISINDWAETRRSGVARHSWERAEVNTGILFTQDSQETIEGSKLVN
jgi:hypothetical protein